MIPATARANVLSPAVGTEDTDRPMDPAADPNSPPTSPPTAQPYASAQLAKVVTAVRDLRHPTQIGPYVILELIGEGGMGTVYKAEQRQPIHRTVALKVVKLGMDTREVVARFEGERQALAMMSHPNVAKVLDAGATETGRPYFVMEYVHGEPITAYADRHKLTIRQRLELFIQACDAVQHAHQKAIIHRDLKPSNILVTTVSDKPHVKVIDFGVAKAVSQRLTERTLFTETGQLVGTPEYMAPEQAESSMLDVDTRADVYSLGVVLYELLSGALPFEAKTLRSGGYNEIQRIIREVDPPRPSTRLSKLGKAADEVARLRQTPLDSLERQLKRELEWIPLMALRKDRAQRYTTVTELAHDVENYLADRPLRAGPESAAYRARKFFRRNKTGVAASAAMVFLLLAGITATTWQAVRATRAEARTRAEQQRTLEQKREADRRRAEAEGAKAATAQVNAFLVEMFESADPQFARGKPVLVRDVLDKAAQGIDTKFAAQPRVQSAVRSTLGRTYFALGLYEQAEAQFARALELDRQVLGPDDPQTLESQQHLGRLRRVQGRYEEARTVYEDTLARRRRVLGEHHADTAGAINDLAVVLDRMGSPDAEATYRLALERFTALAGPDDPETLRVTGNLGQLLQRIGRYDEAERLLRRSFEGRRRTLGEDHPDTIAISTRLAYTMRHRNAWAEAEALMREALDRSARVLGPEHPGTIWAENGLAQLLGEQGKYDEAIPRYLHALELSRKTLGDDNVETLGLMSSAASMLFNAGRAADAEPLLREAWGGLTKARGPDHPLTIATAQNLCMQLRYQQRWAEALPIAKDGYERLREPGRVQFEPVRRAAFLGSYGICLSRLGRHEEAIEPLKVAREALRETGDVQAVTVMWVLKCLADSSQALARDDEAARWSAELDTARAATQPATQPAAQPATLPATQPESRPAVR